MAKTVVDKETNARFWAQTNYKPGQKLDPKDPLDAKMIPVWLDIHAKVKREASAGKLVTTFDHPVVAQNLADADVANQAAAAHLDVAASSSDPTTTQQNVAAAATAAEIAAQKTREAATIQPATVSPALTQEAAAEASRMSPPAYAPPSLQIAHAQVKAMRSPMPPRDMLIKETNTRFWEQTRYKPGQKLDMSVPMDRKMSKVWLEIFDKVQDEASAGKFVLTYPSMPPARPMPPMRPSMPMPPPGMAPMPMPPPETASMPPMGPMEMAPMPQDVELVAPPSKKFSTGTIIAIVAGVAAAGGIAYALTRPRKSPSRTNVFVATPTRAVPVRAFSTSRATSMRSLKAR